MRLRASSMPRVMPCPGSYELEARYPDTGRDAAAEGTAAHGYAATRLTGGSPIIPDAQMLSAVEMYADVCNKYHVEGSISEVEAPLEHGDFTGQPDFYAWSADCLTVIDFKYGYGWVEVKDNWQLLMYAVLVWLHNGGVMPPLVRLVIVQPRANHPDGPVREWTFEGELLRNYYNMFRNTAGEIQAGTAVCKSGPHCRYCRALVDCHTSMSDVSALADYAARPIATTITDEGIARELEFVKSALDLIQHRYNAIEAQATERLQSGHIVPGYMLKQTYTALKWDAPDPIAAARDIGADISKPAEPITPTQAIQRKILTKGMVELMASRKPGAFKLQRENLTQAKQLIKGVTS